MPRKLRHPKARRPVVAVSEALYNLLLWGDVPGDHDRSETWQLFDWDRHRGAWQAIVDEALPQWVGHYPGTRPRSWWLWTAPELRLVVGRFTYLTGAGRCQPTGVPYGQPVDWNDLPTVES